MIKISQIAQSLPSDKSRYDRLANPLAFYFARPISFPVTAIMVSWGISANAASLISLVFAVMACVLAVLGMTQSALVLILLWLVFDCVDGNIARFTKSGSKAGEYLDAISGYVLTAGVYAAYGYATGVLWACLIGGVASTFTVLSRLLLNKYNVLSQSQRSASGEVGDGSLLQQIVLSAYNLSGTGFLLLAAAVIFELMPLFLIFQCCLGAAITMGIAWRSFYALQVSA